MVTIGVVWTRTCDFCSQPNPTRSFPCPEFCMAEAKGYPELRSVGNWEACSQCGKLIDASDWSGLLKRGVANHRERFADMPRPVLTTVVKESHDLFRRHWVKQ